MSDKIIVKNKIMLLSLLQYLRRYLVVLTIIFTTLNNAVTSAQALYENVLSVPSFKTRASDIWNDGMGHFFITAFSYPATYDSSMSLIIKTNDLMQLEWVKRFKILHRDYLTCISPCKDGNLLLGGSARENFNQNSGACLFKVDTSGNLIWSRQYSLSYDDALLKVFEQQDNSLMVFIRNGVSNVSNRVLHCDSNGIILSAHTYSVGFSGLYGESVTTDGQGNYFLCGTVAGGAGNAVLFVSAFRQDSLLWFKQYDPGRIMTAYGICRLDDGTLTVNGSIADPAISNSYNVWLMRIDTLGNSIWAKEYQQPLAYSETIGGIQSLPNTCTLMLGQANTTNGFTAFAAKIDATGNPVWAGDYGNFPFQSFYTAYPLTDGRILMNAFTLNEAYFTMTDAQGHGVCNNHPMTLLAAPLNFTVSAVNPVPAVPAITTLSAPVFVTTPQVSISNLCSGNVGTQEWLKEVFPDVFPNPCSDHFYFYADRAEEVRLQLFNSSGGVVLSQYYSCQPGWNLVRTGKRVLAGTCMLLISGDTGFRRSKLCFVDP